jgi:hypothetical protein
MSHLVQEPCEKKAGAENNDSFFTSRAVDHCTFWTKQTE